MKIVIRPARVAAAASLLSVRTPLRVQSRARRTACVCVIGAGGVAMALSPGQLRCMASIAGEAGSVATAAMVVLFRATSVALKPELPARIRHQCSAAAEPLVPGTLAFSAGIRG